MVLPNPDRYPIVFEKRRNFDAFGILLILFYLWPIPFFFYKGVDFIHPLKLIASSVLYVFVGYRIFDNFTGCARLEISKHGFSFNSFENKTLRSFSWDEISKFNWTANRVEAILTNCRVEEIEIVLAHGLVNRASAAFDHINPRLKDQYGISLAEVVKILRYHHSENTKIKA